MHRRSETMLHLGIFSFGHFVLWSLLHRCSDIDGIRFRVVIKLYYEGSKLKVHIFLYKLRGPMCQNHVSKVESSHINLFLVLIFTDLCIGM